MGSSSDCKNSPNLSQQTFHMITTQKTCSPGADHVSRFSLLHVVDVGRHTHHAVREAPVVSHADARMPQWPISVSLSFRPLLQWRNETT